MKNLIKKIQNKANELAIRTKTAVEGKTAEMYGDKGVGIIIAVVVGAVLLAGIYALIKTTVLDTASGKVADMFNYAG